MITKVSFDEAQSAWFQAYTHNSIQAPFFSYQWHALWYEVLADGWQPYVLIVDDTIIAPFARKAGEVIFSGGGEIADYQDIIGPEDKKPDAWKQILDFLKADGITTIRLRNVPQSSPTISFFQQLSNAVVEKEDTTPMVKLPPTWEEYVESLAYKDRHELRRKIRKFEREHKPTITKSDNPSRDIETLLDLMRKDKKKAVFLTPPMTLFFQKLAGVFRDEISLLILLMDDTPASATLSFINDNASLLYNSGFDRTCCPNAGWYLKAISIKAAIEKGLKEYNFLQGSEPYKYNLGGTDFFVYSIQLIL